MSEMNKIIDKITRRGIPLPLIRDPHTKRGSVALTLVFMSYTLWLASVVGKISGLLDMGNPQDLFNMVVACFGLYFGRKLTSSEEKTVEPESLENTPKQ